jgi:hypothetical protein
MMYHTHDLNTVLCHFRWASGHTEEPKLRDALRVHVYTGPEKITKNTRPFVRIINY